MDKGYSMTKRLDLTYTASAGLLLSDGKNKLLIDGMCKTKVPYYRSTPDELAKVIITGKGIYNNIDVIMYTHHHDDHFSLDLTNAFIERHKETQCINSATDSKLATVSIGEVKVTPIKTIHMGKEYTNTEHYSYHIQLEGCNVFFTGDADLVHSNFTHPLIMNQDVDLLIAPFPFVAKGNGRKLVTDIIGAKNIAVMHLPDEKNDPFEWVKSTMKAYKRIKDRFIPVTFLEELGKTYQIEVESVDR